MPALKADEVSKFIGSDVQDDFGRILGTLIAVDSDIDGNVVSATLKVADRQLEVVEGARVKVSEGKVIVEPSWKHEILVLIEDLDRAFRRRKAIDAMAKNNDLPDVVIEPIKKRLDDEIKVLKMRAEDVKKLVTERIGAIDDESLGVAKAVATLRIAYFSGEIGDRAYNQSMNSLRRLQESLSNEKRSAKELLERLDKVLQLASESEAKKTEGTESEAQQAPVTQPVQSSSVQQAPSSTPQALVVKIEG